MSSKPFRLKYYYACTFMLIYIANFCLPLCNELLLTPRVQQCHNHVGMVWASQLWCMCACWFGLTTYCKFKMSALKHFMMIECSCRRVLQLSWKNELEGLPARLPGRRGRQREQRQSKLNALAAHMATYFLINYGMNLTIVWQGRLWVTDSRMYGGG